MTAGLIYALTGVFSNCGASLSAMTLATCSPLAVCRCRYGYSHHTFQVVQYSTDIEQSGFLYSFIYRFIIFSISSLSGVNLHMRISFNRIVIRMPPSFFDLFKEHPFLVNVMPQNCDYIDCPNQRSIF